MKKHRKLNATEVTGRQIVQSLSEPMVESDSESEDELINSTSSVKYNTDISTQVCYGKLGYNY